MNYDSAFAQSTVRLLQPLHWSDFVEEWTIASLAIVAYLAWFVFGHRRAMGVGDLPSWAIGSTAGRAASALPVSILVWGAQANANLSQVLDVCGRPSAVSVQLMLFTTSMRALLVLVVLIAVVRLVVVRALPGALVAAERSTLERNLPGIVVASVAANYLFLSAILLVYAAVEARG